MVTRLSLSLLVVLFCLVSVCAYGQSVVNLALNRPVVVSSYENATTLPAAAAVDGDYGTRWESQWAHDPEWIYVDLGAVMPIERVKLTWERAYGKDFQVQVSDDAATWRTVRSITGNTSLTSNLSDLATKGRYVRIFGTARGTEYGYSLFEFEVYNTANLSFSQPSYASSSLGDNVPGRAFDENTSTRWESQHGRDPEWVYVDLGAICTVQEITLLWERAAGKDFQLQISNDATAWTTIQTVTNNSALTNSYSGLNKSCRYVRMYGTARTTQYGYSLYEFSVYGSRAAGSPGTTLPVSLTAFSAKADQHNVRLQWATASEKNNQGFEVQRSIDGQSFTALTFVAGAGSTETARHYQYLDASAPTGQLYYRLKQTDTDGTAVFSPVAAVKVTGSVANGTYATYPNPATDQATVTWSTPVPATVRLTLRAGNGTLLLQQATTEQLGANVATLDLSSYPAGVYFLSVYNEQGVVYQSRLVKL